MKKKIFLGLILCSFLSIFILTGCDNSKKIDVDNCISINYKGYDGTGIFEGSISKKKLREIPELQKLTADMVNGEYKVTLKADKEKDLKNGDKIKLELDYNKDLYKRDFDVELVLKESEVEVKGLNKLISKESDLTQEQWNKLNNAVNKKVDELAKNYGYKDKKYLCKTISITKNEDWNSITYWYEFKKSNGNNVYVSALFNNSGDPLIRPSNFESNINLGTSNDWNEIDINKPFNDILKDLNKDSNYTIIK